MVDIQSLFMLLAVQVVAAIMDARLTGSAAMGPTIGTATEAAS